MTKVCLIRHGQTDWNLNNIIQGQEDIRINKTGAMQAEEAAEYLSSDNWDVIISSPLIRAKMTAEIIADKLGLKEIVVVNDFIERNWGAATGLERNAVKSKYPNEDVPGVEPWEELANRGMKALNNVVKNYKNKRIIIVSHGALIRTILDNITAGKTKIEFGRLSNASVSIINNNDDFWDIEELNHAINEEHRKVVCE